MRRRGTAIVALAALLVGCTAAADDDGEVDVLAEVLVDDEVDDDVDAGTDEADEVDPAPAADDTDADDTDAEDGDAQAADPDEAAAPTTDDDATTEPDPPAPAAPSASAPATGSGSSTPVAPVPAPSSSSPAPAPTPAPLELAATEVTATGFVASIDGEWTVGSAATFDPDEATPPLAVALASAARGAQEELSCEVVLRAPDDRGLVARGEVVVALATTEGDVTTVVPRLRIPIDVTLVAGDEFELPVRSTLLSHGERDRSTTCVATFTP